MKRNALANTEAALKKALGEMWGDLPTIITTSAENKDGRDEVLELITNANAEYRAAH